MKFSLNFSISSESQQSWEGYPNEKFLCSTPANFLLLSDVMTKYCCSGRVELRYYSFFIFHFSFLSQFNYRSWRRRRRKLKILVQNLELNPLFALAAESTVHKGSLTWECLLMQVCRVVPRRASNVLIFPIHFRSLDFSWGYDRSPTLDSKQILVLCVSSTFILLKPQPTFRRECNQEHDFQSLSAKQ